MYRMSCQASSTAMLLQACRRRNEGFILSTFTAPDAVRGYGLYNSDYAWGLCAALDNERCQNLCACCHACTRNMNLILLVVLAYTVPCYSVSVLIDALPHAPYD